MFWVEGTRFDPEHDESETFIACSLKQEAKSRILENPDGEMDYYFFERGRDKERTEFIEGSCFLQEM